MKKWREYERLVALLTTEDYNEDNFTVIPNARIKGFLSGRKRQIDVLVDYRFNTNLNNRIIFDAKHRKRPIDIKEIESFEGLMADVGAKRGFIICNNGYTKAALRRAQQHIGIKLLSSDELEDFNLSAFDSCNNINCSEGLVLWDCTPGIIIDDGPVSAQATGKCDVCGKFNIWCWSCGNKLCIEYESELQCSCKGPWFWLTCIEPDNDDGEQYESHYLILVMFNGTYYIIDRRPI